MSFDEIYPYLPPLHQKVIVLLAALVAVAILLGLTRNRRMREEHALLWFIGLVLGTVLVWVDPLLVAVTYALGVGIPASALLFMAVFFLFIVCVWLTASISKHKRQLEHLIITVSLLDSELARVRAQPAKPTAGS